MKAIVLICLVVLLTACPGPTPPPSTDRWLDNDVQALIDSTWMQHFGYGDCGLDGCKVWPQRMIDCVLPETMQGPSEVDRAFVADPPGLFYRHLTPRQIFESGQSLIVGVKPNLCGRELYSISLMVHSSEKSHIEKIGVEARIKEFFQPYVEGAIGMPIQTADLVPLYEGALYNCGKDSDATGQGLQHVFNNYVAVVQFWDGMQDCNIHVVKVGG